MPASSTTAADRQDRDAITIFRTLNGGRANKQITLDADGQPVKVGAPQTGSFWAQQVQVPDLAALADLGARSAPGSTRSRASACSSTPDPTRS